MHTQNIHVNINTYFLKYVLRGCGEEWIIKLGLQHPSGFCTSRERGGWEEGSSSQPEKFLFFKYVFLIYWILYNLQFGMGIN